LWYCHIVSDIIWTNGHIFRTVLLNNFFLAVYNILACCRHLFPVQHTIKEHEGLAKNREIVHSRWQSHTKFSNVYFDIFSVSFFFHTSSSSSSSSSSSLSMSLSFFLTAVNTVLCPHFTYHVTVYSRVWSTPESNLH